MPRAWIGTSGWAYDEWGPRFYAQQPRARWLERYARAFDAVEVNATFYHLLGRATYVRWHAQTPANFRFAIKASRYLTHVRRLDFPLAALARQRDAARGLGRKLGVVLWQLPATLRADAALLERFLARLAGWDGVRHALEFRHPSWFDEAVRARLRRARVAVVQSDAADWPIWRAVSTNLVYVRLHGHRRTYVSPYAAATLGRWAERCRAWLAEGRQVHVYFDNTAQGQALRDATRLRRRLSREAAR
jgi:uncharacterized protein YecE (DUF72 family)